VREAARFPLKRETGRNTHSEDFSSSMQSR
jgi:hypothetical protein